MTTPNGLITDRVADLEMSLAQTRRDTSTHARPQAPAIGIMVRNAVSAIAPGETEYTPTNEPRVIFTNDDESLRSPDDQPRITAKTRDGSFINKEGEKLVVYYYAGRWWIVTAKDKTSLVYLGDPASSDLYVEPNAEGVYDARLCSINVPLTVTPDEDAKVWLMIGQKYQGDSITPLPRGLILLSSLQGNLFEGATDDQRPLYYSDHYPWLYVKLDLSSGDELTNALDGNAIVLDGTGEPLATEIAINVWNYTGVPIPNEAKVFVDHHAQTGQWWIRHYVEETPIARAIVYDASIDHDAVGGVKRQDCESGYEADPFDVTNTQRPLFKDESVIVARDRCRNWIVLSTPVHTLKGIAVDAFAKGDTATVQLDTLTDTPTIEATSLLGAVAADDIVFVIWTENGWHIIAAECPSE
jgi:hypothetical protein